MNTAQSERTHVQSLRSVSGLPFRCSERFYSNLTLNVAKGKSNFVCITCRQNQKGGKQRIDRSSL